MKKEYLKPLSYVSVLVESESKIMSDSMMKNPPQSDLAPVRKLNKLYI